MRGTQRVGSLLRLFLGAAFLCLAWVLLSAATADAAERSTLLDSVAPVVGQLQTTTSGAVDGTVGTLKAVATAVPVLERPVTDLADDVVAVTDAVPVIGRKPIVALPLAERPATPQPPKVPIVVAKPKPAPHPIGVMRTPVKSVAPQRDSVLTAESAEVPRGVGLAVLDATPPLDREPVTARSDARPSGSGSPQPSHLPEPSPQSAPMPPTQPVPNPGGAASAGDLAALGPVFVLPCLASSGPGSANWKVPRGLPAHPGTRPD